MSETQNIVSEIKKRVRDAEISEECEEEDSPEAKRIRSDLLGILDDAELESEPAVDDAARQTPDLELVMKSFEEEISLPSPAALPVISSPEEVTEVAEVSDPVKEVADLGEVQPEIGLGYLFEASDDELGLPPAFAEEKIEKVEEELPRVPSYGFGLDDEQMWRFEDEMQSYDEFGAAVGANSESSGEFLALDGLFDHSDVYYGQPEFLYRPESLSAL